MISKKQEERNEKIIRGLMKLPPNRRCINCNNLGPQYVCTNYWTFVCIACSGIHREFTHRVKSVSMSKFTSQEVEALQRGGNQCAREMFLKEWDTQRMRLPDSSNADKIRAFIKDVYLHKKYAGGRTPDMSPRDMQSLKNHEEKQRRASSYHSYSQSPPDDYQYDDRHYGKQIGRRPSSDRGLHEGKISSFVYSPGQLRDQMYEDRSANGSSGSRASDYSLSSTGDPFRFDGQSPNFLDSGYSSPCLHQVRNNLVEDAQPQMLNRFSEVNVKRHLDGFRHPQRTASSSSFGSFDSNSVSLKSVNSGSSTDVVLVPEHSTGTQQALGSTFHSLSDSSASLQAKSQDLFSLQPPMTSVAPALDLFADISNQSLPTTVLEQKTPMTSAAPILDLFADINNQPLPTTTLERKTSTVPLSEDDGWATFDLPYSVGPASERNKGISAMVLPVDGAANRAGDALASMHNNSQCFPFQSSAAVGPFISSTFQQNVGLRDDRTHADQRNSQSWNAFDDSNGNIPYTSFGGPSHNTEPHIPMQKSRTSGDPFIGLNALEGHFKDGLQKFLLDDTISGPSLPFNVLTGSSFPPTVLPLKGGATQAQKSTNPFDLPYELDLDAKDTFSDMSSLQAALPNAQLPTANFGDLNQQWFNLNAVPTIIPSIPQGGLAYSGRQAPQSSPLPTSPPQGPVASSGGNPFA